VSVDGEDVTIYTMAERVPVPLSIMHNPVCITFSFYHGGDTIVLDATRSEEQVRETSITLTVNDFELCQVSKMGGNAVDAVILLKCINTALAKGREINGFVAKKLAEDATKRDVGGLIAELRAENER
jgi:exosome complex component RRP45